MTNDYNEHYEIVKTYIDMLDKNLNHGLLIVSKGGLGKTTLITNAMKDKGYQLGEQYLYFNNYSTPLRFFETLAQTNELKPPRFLVLDDTELMMSSRHILGMLKSALWEVSGKRPVNYLSTSGKVDEELINFTGKIIILLNDMPTDNAVLHALKDRVFFHEIIMTNQQILQAMSQLVVPASYGNLNQKQRTKIFQVVANMVDDTTNLSFRTLIKAYQFFIHSPRTWEAMLASSLGNQKPPVGALAVSGIANKSSSGLF